MRWRGEDPPCCLLARMVGRFRLAKRLSRLRPSRATPGDGSAGRNRDGGPHSRGRRRIFIRAGDTVGPFSQGKDCFFVHKFSARGERLASFSPCSESTAWAKEAAGAREGITRGRLWWQDGWLYHVLHPTRVVRIFKADGTPVRTVSFVAPDSSQLFASAGLKADPRLNRVWRIAHLPDGRFLIEWLHVESPGLGTQRATTFVALHDEQGRPLCVGSHPPVRPAIPVAVDAGAACCFCT